MATINGIPMDQARLRGELCNATDYTEAEMTVWLLEDSATGWRDSVRPVSVRLRLMPGYGSESHLFDRAAATVAAAVDGRLFASLAAVRKAAEGVSHRESLRYSVEVEEGVYHVPVPAELEGAAEAIRDRIRAKEAAKRRREQVQFVRGLAVYRGEDGMYRVTTADGHRRGHWVDAIDRRYWCCYGLEVLGGGAVSTMLSSPNVGYATAEAAEAVLAAVQAHYA